MRLQTIFTILVLAAIALVFSGCRLIFGEYEFKGNLIDPPLDVPDFALTTANDETFRLSDVGDDLVLVFFGYTFCPDVCPLTLADVKVALSNFEQRDKVTVLFVSVDPERDTPETVTEYVTSFDPEFIGLTADEFAKIQEVMLPFGAYAEKEEVNNSVASYLVNHTARLYLVIPDKGLMLTYPFGFEAEDLRSDLAYLLQPEK